MDRIWRLTIIILLAAVAVGHSPHPITQAFIIVWVGIYLVADRVDDVRREPRDRERRRRDDPNR
jgi:desulfoferrodoxin (superoxide reductase-like protein)